MGAPIDIFAQDFMPHGHCFLWIPALVWMHALSDALIGIAYVAIAVSLYVIVRRVRLPLSSIVLSFGIFIGACGATHFLDVWNLWFANYWVAGWAKVITAVASVFTSIALVRLRPQIYGLAGAAKLAEQRRIDLEHLNQSLQDQVAQQTRELREQKQLLQDIIDQTDSTIFVKDLTGKYVLASQQLCRLLARERDDIIGKTDLELFPAPQSAGYIENDKAVLASKTSMTWEEDVHTGEGVRTFISSKSPLNRANGETYAIAGIATDITTLKQTQNDLDRRTRLLETILEQMPSAAIIAEAPSGRILTANRRMEEIWRNETPSSNSVDEYAQWIGFHADGRRYSGADWPLGRAIRHGETVNDEPTHVEFGDGSRGVLTISAAPVRSASGEIIAGVVICNDVTAQLAAEERLRTSEQRLKRAMLATGVGVWEVDGRTQKTWRSTTHDSIYGLDYEPDRTLEFFFTRVLDEDRERARADFERAFSSGLPWNAEYRVRWPDQSIHWMHVLAQVECDVSGQTVRMIGTNRDVTDEKRNLDAIRESEAKFRTITNAMPQMVWSTLPDGHHDYFNTQWYHFTGMPDGSTDGEAWQNVFHPEDQPLALETWERSLKTGEPYEIEYRLRHRSGEYRWTLGRALPLRGSNGEIIRWMGTCTEIHEHKIREEELNVALRARDQFLSIASHELKTPITSIAMQTQMQERQIRKGIFPDQVKIKKYIEGNQKQVSRLVRLIEDMLDVARVRNGKLHLNFETRNLAEIVGEVIERNLSRFEQFGRAVVLRTEPNLIAVVDVFRFEQALENLLNNAYKYAPESRVDVMLSARPTGHARITVRDYGPGIDESNHQKIFNRFERCISASEVSGLGLGLFIVREIVEAHGGQVWVESQLGQGAEFIIEIPLQPGEGASHEPV